MFDKIEVCDRCLMVAADEGMPDRESQVYAMIELGGELADHLCDAKEEPGLNIRCECACNLVRVG